MQPVIDTWNLQIRVFPVLVALLLCELPGIIRHFKNLAYVPIYFALFPFRELNRDLSLYVGEDFFTGSGDMTESETEALRKRIVLTGLISLSIAAVATPAVAGFLAAFFMLPTDFRGFVLLFIAYKMIGLIRAAFGFKHHAVSNRRTMMWYWATYLTYFAVFLTVFEAVFDWAHPFTTKGDWLGLWKELRGVLFLKIAVGGFIASLVGASAAAAFTDRKLRNSIVDRSHE